MTFSARHVTTERLLSEKGGSRFKARLLPARSVSFVCIGATIGKCAMTQVATLTNQQINSIVVDAENHSPDFVYYLLRHHAPEIRQHAGGAATPILNKTAFSRIELPIPPLPAQQTIAAVLAAYDELIENNLRRIEILEEMAEALYREWFVNFRFPGYEVVARVDSPLGPIPEGWEVRTVGELYEVSLGGTPPRARAELWDGNIPWINSGSVNLVRVIEGDEYITEEAVATSNTKLWPRGATLIAITGATLGQVSRLAIDSCANQSVVGVWDPDARDSDFIFYAVRDRIQHLISRAGGSAQQHINKGIVQDFQLLKPLDGIVCEFADQVAPLNQLLENLLLQNANLRTTCDLLLQRLISGEIDVSDLEIDTEWLAS